MSAFKDRVKLFADKFLITALAGLLVPIVMFPFTQGQLPLAGFLYNVNRMEVVLYEGERPVGDVLPLKRSSDWGEQVRRGMRQLEQQRLFEEKRIAFPYRYCLLGGAALFFVGLASFMLSYKKAVMKDS